jgi:phosphate/sulfate permease
MTFFDAVGSLPTIQVCFLLFALVVAFGFEFINGFHDTANAVTTVIYTRTMTPTPAVLFSGFCNFFGVLLGGTAVAFSIVNLLPVDLLVDTSSPRALVIVLSLLLAGVIWNLGTWYLGLPVSSSHTLIGSILGVGIMNGLMSNQGLGGVAWGKAGEVGIALLISPIIGFVASAVLMLVMKATLKEPKLYIPPQGDDRPPGWIRAMLISTCGGVSFAHGSNDGQKGMGLILLVLIGFMPMQYALDWQDRGEAKLIHAAATDLEKMVEDATIQPNRDIKPQLELIETALSGKSELSEVPQEKRWELRQAIIQVTEALKPLKTPEVMAHRKTFLGAIEFVPLWVVVGVALALGVGTTIGYKRIVITVAEKIGKTHLTYAQGASAELVAAATIMIADMAHMPVSTTQVLSSGVCGTMVANKSGVQMTTCKKIMLAWAFTLPGTILLSGLFTFIGLQFV